MKAAAAKDQSDYDALFRTHHARVVRLCRLLLSDPDEADDVTQEVFLKLFQACEKLSQAYELGDREIAWGAWLTRVAVNGCRDRRRSGWWKWWRERHEEFAEANLPSATLNPEQQTLSNEARRGIWRCFRQLSARQQEVFALRQLEGWSTEEVAQTLGLSPGSVKRHLYRAVHHMRTGLGGYR
ncbi:MAG: sigma-70 family RNA polymerase sigma factor [Deltaproteobacteria bacterium]|nr:sigma-70 family RNA polymerase sigma factor [Deltaproteobacteria bacterium]MBI3386540.1 sigma-70 family RNA polymerase sigma factor [Deltaproteobacteria bacterium]